MATVTNTSTPTKPKSPAKGFRRLLRFFFHENDPKVDRFMDKMIGVTNDSVGDAIVAFIMTAFTLAVLNTPSVVPVNDPLYDWLYFFAMIGSVCLRIAQRFDASSWSMDEIGNRIEILDMEVSDRLDDISRHLDIEIDHSKD